MSEETDRPSFEEMQHFRTVQPPITDREMWIAIRSGILGIVAAIESFGGGGPLALATRAGLLVITDAIERRWEIRKRRMN